MSAKRPPTPGAVRFTCILDAKLGRKFVQDCKREDRNMSSMARHLIRLHYRNSKDGVNE